MGFGSDPTGRRIPRPNLPPVADSGRRLCRLRSTRLGCSYRVFERRWKAQSIDRRLLPMPFGIHSTYGRGGPCCIVKEAAASEPRKTNFANLTWCVCSRRLRSWPELVAAILR